MTSIFFKGLFSILFVSILLVSCEKMTNEISQPEQVTSPYGTLTVLGKKLPNPYDPENVKLAWENLTKTQPELTKDVAIDFNPTHVYVKFVPKNANELEQLRSKYGKDLSDIPSFYEYPTMGDYYIDPSVKDGMPTFQYATLAVGTALPNDIEYEVLEKLILMDFSKKVNGTVEYNEELDNAYHYELYRTSRLTHLFYGASGQRGLFWRPSGELRLTNSDGSFSPLENVKVKMLDVIYIPIIGTEMMSGRDGKFRCGRSIGAQARYRVYLKTENYTSHLRHGSPLKLRICFWDTKICPSKYINF